MTNLTPTQHNVIKAAETIILAQSDVMKDLKNEQKERPVVSLPMDVTELRRAVLEMWEDGMMNLDKE